MSFETAFRKVVMVEGGYSDHPNDKGGKTQFGITEAVARANGFNGDMRLLQLSQAKVIYQRQYWDTLSLDQVDAISSAVAHKLFDLSVNMGTGIAGRFLQRSLNVLNRGETDFQDATIDGVVGPMTLAMLRAYSQRRGEDGEVVLLRAINGLQVARYIEISESRKANESFTYGWLKNRVSI